MQRFAAFLLIGIAVGILAAGTAQAGGGDGGCRHARCCGHKAGCDCDKEKVEYEPHTVTLYRTEYKEIPEKKLVDAVQYVPATEIREVPCTVCVAKAKDPCDAGCGHKSAGCGPKGGKAPCCQETGVRKVPVTVYHEKPIKKEVTVTRLEEKKIPYTYVCYVPKKKPCPPCECRCRGKCLGKGKCGCACAECAAK